MNKSTTAAAIANPMPRPSATTLRFSSSAASSSSRRMIALVRSATSLTAAPTPCASVSRVGMSPPVDPLGQGDSRDDGDANDEPRIRAAAVPVLRPLAELRARTCERGSSRLLVRRRLALGARLDQARLHLPDEAGILRQRLGQLGFEPALRGEVV